MYKRAVNFFRGDVRVCVESAYPERVLNLCGVREIPFWGVEWRSPTTIALHTTHAGLRRLQEIEECTVTWERESGVPALWQRMKKRYVLLGGLMLLWLLLFGGSTFIWGFSVSGNDTVPTETILRALEDYGLGIGSPALSVDQEDLRNHVLLQLHDVSWLAVNVKGCVAHVQVVERLRPPERVAEQEISNVVARCSGLVTRIEALDGKTQVAVGSTVTEGQILISGIADSEQHGMRLMHGQGRVWARTWYNLSVKLPLEQETKTEKNRTKTRVALDFGKKRIKFYGKAGVSGAECDKIIQYHPITLAGLRLPLTLVTETLSYYDCLTESRDTAAVQQQGEQQLLEELSGLLGEDGEISGKRFSTAQQGSYLVVNLQAECVEQIGRSVTLPIETD